MQDVVKRRKPGMVRKQVFITADQNRQLKVRARATGQAEAVIIRAAIDKVLGTDEGTDDWKRRLVDLQGALADDGEHMSRQIAENRARWGARIKATRAKLNDDE